MNYMITVPIYQSKVEEIGEALIEHVLLNIAFLIVL